MSNDLISTVLELSGLENDEIVTLKIEALLNEILSYTNRDELSDEMFPVAALVITECLNNGAVLGNIQSLSEGDMQVVFKGSSPFFGKLDSFKVIRGIN